MGKNIINNTVTLSLPMGTTSKRICDLEQLDIHYGLSDLDKTVLIQMLIRELKQYDN